MMGRIDKPRKIEWVSFLCFAIIALQNPIWPLWRFGTYLSFVCILILAYLLSKRKNRYFSKAYTLAVLLLFISFIVIQQIRQFTPSSFLYFITFLFVLKLSDNEKSQTLSYIGYYLSIIITLSLPCWLIHEYVFSFPQFGTIDISALKGIKDTYLNNYLFFVTYPNASFPRFFSMFDEPGVLGTLGAFVLCANNYDFKDRKNIIILLGCLFTFSLAFYALTVVGLILKSIKGSVFKMVFSLFLVFSLFYTVDYLLKDNETYQLAIQARLGEGLENSLEARSSEYTNDFFDKFIHTPESLIGIGVKNAEQKGFLEQGNSYRIFVIKYGWLSVLAILIAYWSLAYPKNKKNLTLFILVVLSFLQRPQSWVAWELILFVCATESYNNGKKIFER